MLWKRSTLSFLCLLLSWTVIGVEAEKENEKPSPRYVRFSDQKVDWAEAKARCEKIGMRLAEPDDFSEFISVLGGRSYLYEAFWVGGVRVDNNKLDYVWETTRKPILNNWMPKEPNGYPGENCVDLEQGHGWNNFFCNRRLGYICEHLREEKETKRRYDDEIVTKINEYDKESPKVENSPWRSRFFGRPYMEELPERPCIRRRKGLTIFRKSLMEGIYMDIYGDDDCRVY